MIRGKRMRPLAAVSDKPLELEGYGTIEPITKWAPGITCSDQLLRHLHPEGRAAGGRQDARQALGRQHRQERGAEASTRRAAAPCSGRLPARRRRRPSSLQYRPTRGCCTTAASPRCRPTRSASRGRSGGAGRARLEHRDTRRTAHRLRPRRCGRRRAIWIAIGAAIVVGSLEHGPAREAGHQSVRRARPACRACSGLIIVVLGDADRRAIARPAVGAARRAPARREPGYLRRTALALALCLALRGRPGRPRAAVLAGVDDLRLRARSSCCSARARARTARSRAVCSRPGGVAVGAAPRSRSCSRSCSWCGCRDGA